jgi:DNA polymerase-3 subunit epsilon
MLLRLLNYSNVGINSSTSKINVGIMVRTKKGKSSFDTQLLDDVDFLVVDVETTGLSMDRGDRVCEIGAVKLRGSAIVDTFGTLVDPCRPISSGAYAVNHISPEMLIDAPTFETIAPKLQQMMNDTVLVAYNAPFDLSFFSGEFRLAGLPPIRNVVVDALAIARQVLPGLPKYGQEHVARTIGINFPVKHRALEDAMLTAQLFVTFISILKAHECTTCADLHRYDLMQALHLRRMSIVENALSGKHNLWIKYLSPGNAEIIDRVITPKECVMEKFGKNGTTYLVAYCHSAGAERNFRIDRMLDVRIMSSGIV